MDLGMLFRIPVPTKGAGMGLVHIEIPVDLRSKFVAWLLLRRACRCEAWWSTHHF